MRAAGRCHTLTVRDVQLSEAGEVKLIAKDFETQAQLIIRGKTWFCSSLLSVLFLTHL